MFLAVLFNGNKGKRLAQRHDNIKADIVSHTIDLRAHDEALLETIRALAIERSHIQKLSGEALNWLK